MKTPIGEIIKNLRSRMINRQLAHYLFQLYERFNWRFSLLDVGCGTGIALEISQLT